MKLKGLKHSEAAAVLSNANGEICLEVQFLIPDYHKINENSNSDQQDKDKNITTESEKEVNNE